jgi:hypothetical protein
VDSVVCFPAVSKRLADADRLTLVASQALSPVSATDQTARGAGRMRRGRAERASPNDLPEARLRPSLNAGLRSCYGAASTACLEK